MINGGQVLKDGLRFWPEMKCECGHVGCYDLTTDIGCKPCLTARGKILVVTQQPALFSHCKTCKAPDAGLCGQCY